MPHFSIILPAAGKSTRFEDRTCKKTFVPLGDKPVWLHSALRFLEREDVVELIVVIDAQDQGYFEAEFAKIVSKNNIKVVIGAEQRSDSVFNGLKAVSSKADFVAVHDAARPCITREMIEAVFSASIQSGAAILAVPVTGTIKRVSAEQFIEQTVSRENLWEAQTPQVARKELLHQAYAQRGQFQPTDEAQLLENAGIPVQVVAGERTNIKITTIDDLNFAKQLGRFQ